MTKGNDSRLHGKTQPLADPRHFSTIVISIDKMCSHVREKGRKNAQPI